MTPTEESRVTDVLTAIRVDIADRLGRIETKLDTAAAVQTATEIRVRTLEFAHVTREDVQDMIRDGRKLSWRDLGMVLAAIATAVTLAVGVVSLTNVG